MKTDKIIVLTEEFACEVLLKKEWDFIKETLIDLVQKLEDFQDQNVVDVADANTNHICKYCGGIAQGTDKDVLCKDCREIFGHAFFSEL